MKRIYLLLMCVLTALIMTATQFSQKVAKRAAEEFLKQKIGKVVSIKAAKVVPISKTQSSVVCKAMAVNLGNNDGFVLIVGNDESNEVIGYCDHGTFNEQHMPHNMHSWLESYMALASACDTRTAEHYPTQIPIAPLLKSKWNQSSPYNDQCPVIEDDHCPTGCTITAMAQVMNYYQWPKAATQAIPAYTPDNNGGTSCPSLPALEPTIFNWSSIYPTYDGGEDGTEVARLHKYIGTAACADYGAHATSATGYKAFPMPHCEPTILICWELHRH